MSSTGATAHLPEANEMFLSKQLRVTSLEAHRWLILKESCSRCETGSGSSPVDKEAQVIFWEPPFPESMHLSVSMLCPAKTETLQEESVKILTTALPLKHEVVLIYKVRTPEDENFTHSFKLATTGFGEAVDDAAEITQLVSL